MPHLRYICTRCQRQSQDGNLWCPELDCPAAMSSHLLTKGDFLGQIEIDELLIFLPHAAIYKATYKKEKVFLKIANPGESNIAYLQREAILFKHLNELRKKHKDKALFAVVPEWLQHDPTAGLRAWAYTESQAQGRYYFLLKYTDGNFLRESLLDNTQPYHLHVGWLLLTISRFLAQFPHMPLATALINDAELAVNAGIFTNKLIHYRPDHRLLHLNLSPDTIYVTNDANNAPQAKLLDMGLGLYLAYKPLLEDKNLFMPFIQPQYRPKEFYSKNLEALSEKTQVRQLAFLAQEILSGRPNLFVLNQRSYAKPKVQSMELNRNDLPGDYRVEGAEQSWENLKKIINDNLNERDLSLNDKTMAEFYERIRSIYKQTAYKQAFSWSRVVQRATQYGTYALLVLLLGFTAVVLVFSFLNGEA